MFKITQPPVIIFGKHSVRDYSFPENCLIVTSRGASPRGWLEYLKLNSYNIFDKVESNPSFQTAETIISEFRNSNFSSVIGLGGGSSMDIAKLPAQIASNPFNSTNLADIASKAPATLRIGLSSKFKRSVSVLEFIIKSVN